MAHGTGGFDPADHAELLLLTADIVGAYVGKNHVAGADLPGLISNVHAELAALGRDATASEPQPVPAVPVNKSVAPAAVTCLECGARFKMLKRHLDNKHGLTPEEYRRKWGLRFDYPLVAPDYRVVRQDIAVKSRLGQETGAWNSRGRQKP